MDLQFHYNDLLWSLSGQHVLLLSLVISTLLFACQPMKEILSSLMRILSKCNKSMVRLVFLTLFSCTMAWHPIVNQFEGCFYTKEVIPCLLVQNLSSFLSYRTIDVSSVTPFILNRGVVLLLLERLTLIFVLIQLIHLFVQICSSVSQMVKIFLIHLVTFTSGLKNLWRVSQGAVANYPRVVQLLNQLENEIPEAIASVHQVQAQIPQALRLVQQVDENLPGFIDLVDQVREQVPSTLILLNQAQEIADQVRQTLPQAQTVINQAHEALPAVEEAREEMSYWAGCSQSLRNSLPVTKVVGMTTFVLVATSTYLYMHHYWRKPKYESLVNQMKDGSIKATLKLIQCGFMAGAIGAGIVDIGLNLAPKDLGCVSVLSQLMSLIIGLFPRGQRKTRSEEVSESNEEFLKDSRRNYGEGMKSVPNSERSTFESKPGLYKHFSTSWDDYEDDDDEDEPAYWIYKIKEAKLKISEFLQENAVQLTTTAIAVLFGLALFLWIHHGPSMLLWIKNRKNMDTKLEAKGKTKGRTFKRIGGRTMAKGKKAPVRKLRKYIVYDNDNIAEMMKDGEFVTWTDFKGKELPPGEYEITRVVGYAPNREPIYRTDEFTISEYEAYTDVEIRGNYLYHFHCASCPQEMLLDMSNEEQLKIMQNHVLNCTLINPVYRCTNCAKELSVDKFCEHMEKCCPFCTKLHPADQHVECRKKFQDDVVNKQLNDIREQREKKEALVPSSPKYKTETVLQFTGSVLDAEKTRLADCLFLTGPGSHKFIIMNTHVVNLRPKFVRTNGKDFELHCDEAGNLKQSKYQFKKYKHSDLSLIEPIDGPTYASKKYFGVAEVNQNVAMVNCNWVKKNDKLEKEVNFSSGKVVGFRNTEGSVSLEYTMTTEPGDCGGLCIDENGKILAIHYQAGKPKKTNFGIAITSEFLDEWQVGSKN